MRLSKDDWFMLFGVVGWLIGYISILVACRMIHPVLFHFAGGLGCCAAGTVCMWKVRP